MPHRTRDLDHFQRHRQFGIYSPAITPKINFSCLLWIDALHLDNAARIIHNVAQRENKWWWDLLISFSRIRSHIHDRETCVDWGFIQHEDYG